MKASLFFLFGVLLTIAITQWDGFLAILSISAPYLLGSLLIVLVLGTVIWLFRRPLGCWAAKKIGGKVEAVYNVAVDSERSTDSKLASVGTEYLNREQFRFLLFFWLGTAGAVVGAFNIYLLYDQNKLIRGQTEELIEQNSDVKIQTTELKVQNKMISDQWRNERRAALLDIIYDIKCDTNNVDKRTCEPRSNLRARQEAVRSYIKLQTQSSLPINLDYANVSEVKLDNMDLTNASFNKAKLNAASFNGSNLNFSSFREASLVGATFSGTKMNSVVLVNANLERAVFHTADLTEANISQAYMASVKLKNSSLRKSKMDGVVLKFSQVSDSDFSQVKLIFSDLTAAQFVRVNFERADLEAAIVSRAYFRAVNFKSSSLINASYMDGSSQLSIACDQINKNEGWKTANGIEHCLPKNKKLSRE